MSSNSIPGIRLIVSPDIPSLLRAIRYQYPSSANFRKQEIRSAFWRYLNNAMEWWTLSLFFCFLVSLTDNGASGTESLSAARKNENILFPQCVGALHRGSCHNDRNNFLHKHFRNGPYGMYEVCPTGLPNVTRIP